MCHHHHHHHHDTVNRKVLFWAFGLTTAFALSELFFSFITGSLVLFSEGIHMLSDGVSLLFGALAVLFGAKVATMKKTFGFKRFETLAAFLNGLTLIVIPVIITAEAFSRFFDPQDVEGFTVLWVATVGLLVNVFIILLLHSGDKENLNLRAASLHVKADLLSSVATILTALCLMLSNWTWIDPLVSILISAYILRGGWSITKESLHLLMEGVPSQVDVGKIQSDIRGLRFVSEITDMKIWSTNGQEIYGMLKVAVNRSDWSACQKELRVVLETYPIDWTIECLDAKITVALQTTNEYSK